MTPVLFKMEEVAKISTKSRSAVYADFKGGILETCLIGSRRRVTRRQLERYLQRITGEAIALDDVEDEAAQVGATALVRRRSNR